MASGSDLTRDTRPAELAQIKDLSADDWLALAFRCFPRLKQREHRRLKGEILRHVIKNSSLIFEGDTAEAIRKAIRDRRDFFECIDNWTKVDLLPGADMCETTVPADFKEFAPTHVLAFPISREGRPGGYRALPIMHLVFAAHCITDIELGSKSPPPNYQPINPAGGRVGASLPVHYMLPVTDVEFEAFRTLYRSLALQDVTILERYILPESCIAVFSLGEIRRSLGRESDRSYNSSEEYREDLRSALFIHCKKQEDMCACMKRVYFLFQAADAMGVVDECDVWTVVCSAWREGGVLWRAKQDA